MGGWGCGEGNGGWVGLRGGEWWVGLTQQMTPLHEWAGLVAE